jgi:hypothetical protein
MTLLGSTFRNLRTKEFLEAQDYIFQSMDSHEPDRGVSGLPSDVKSKILMIVNFYNDLGRLVVHGALDEEVALSSFGENLYQTWIVLHVFIESERNLLPVRFMLYFEDMACRVRDRGQRSVGEHFNLRKWGG